MQLERYAVVVGVGEVVAALRHDLGIVGVAAGGQDDRLGVHLENAAVLLLRVEALDDALLDDEVEGGSAGHDGGAELLGALHHGLDVVAALAVHEPVEGVELAQAVVVVDDAGELDAVGDHPVDVFARRLDHVLPKEVVDAVVEEVLFRVDDVAEGDVGADAGLMLHLGADGEHALGKGAVAADRAALLQKQGVRAELSGLDGRRDSGGTRANYDDVNVDDLCRVIRDGLIGGRRLFPVGFRGASRQRAHGCGRRQGDAGTLQKASSGNSPHVFSPLDNACISGLSWVNFLKDEYRLP